VKNPNASIQFSGSLLLTFRELWATYVVLGLALVITICWIILSFAMNLDVVEGSIAALRIFGIESAPTRGVRSAETGEWVQTALSLDQFMIGIQDFVFGASYFLGTLLGIFATAPLTAATLGESRIGLLLSKPIGRIRFLAGHTSGVFITVLLLATYLVGSVWLALSIKTGIWSPIFLIAIPVITIMFAVMYGVVLLVTVGTNSSGAALISAYGLIFVSFVLAGHEQILRQLGALGGAIFQVIYYALPNFVEVVPLVAQLNGGESVETWLPLVSSLLFGLTCYLGAALWFSRKDF
jgi:ABC-2 type transport system permease protein